MYIIAKSVLELKNYTLHKEIQNSVYQQAMETTLSVTSNIHYLVQVHLMYIGAHKFTEITRNPYTLFQNSIIYV